MPIPLSFLRAKLGNMVCGFTNEAAITGLHTGDSKWVLTPELLGCSIRVIGCFGFCSLSLETGLLYFLLGWVFWGCRLRRLDQFWVLSSESLASLSLSFVRHVCLQKRNERVFGLSRVQEDGKISYGQDHCS